MPHCSAPQCYFQCKGNKHSGVSIHRFPKDPTLRRLWEEACGRHHLPKDRWLCSRHFIPDDFEDYHRPRLLKELVGLSTYKRRLKPNAVPSIFAHTQPILWRAIRAGKMFNHETRPDDVPSMFPTKSDFTVESEMRKLNGNSEGEATVKKSPQKHLDQDQDQDQDRGYGSEDSRPPDFVPLRILVLCSLPVPPENPSEPADSMYEPLSASEKLTETDTSCKDETSELVQTKTLTSSEVEGNDPRCLQMTGLKWGVFLHLFTFVSPSVGGEGSTEAGLPPREQFLLTLVKLRLNPSFEALSSAVNVPASTCTGYFWKWLDLLHRRVGFMVKWPRGENVSRTVPPAFREEFPRLTCIVDCPEIVVDAPRNRLARALCYNRHKQQCTVKVLVGCDPLGTVTFLSRAWFGRASDEQILRDSGFIDGRYHRPGDQILTHTGLTLAEDFTNKCGCELLAPSAREVENSSVKIHIERVVGLMKTRFRILTGQMPVRCAQDESLDETLPNCDKIIAVCAALTNMGESIVYEE